jgi:hypothetical protein
MDRIGLAQDGYKKRALVNAVMNFRIPYHAVSFSSGCTTGGLPSSAQLLIVSYVLYIVTSILQVINGKLSILLQR